MRPLVLSTLGARVLGACALGACVPPVSTTGAPCPCAEGMRCCDDVCVPEDTICEGKGCPLPPVEAPSFAIGAGTPDDETFRALDEDPALPLFSGFQYGYHVYVQLRVTGLDSARVTLDMRLTLPESGEEARTQRWMTTLLCPEEGDAWGAPQGLPLIVCPSFLAGERMDDRDILLDITASDGERTLVAEATIHPNCPDDGQCATTTLPGCAEPDE